MSKVLISSSLHWPREGLFGFYTNKAAVTNLNFTASLQYAMFVYTSKLDFLDSCKNLLKCKNRKMCHHQLICMHYK